MSCYCHMELINPAPFLQTFQVPTASNPFLDDELEINFVYEDDSGNISLENFYLRKLVFLYEPTDYDIQAFAEYIAQTSSQRPLEYQPVSELHIMASDVFTTEEPVIARYIISEVDHLEHYCLDGQVAFFLQTVHTS
jgi:hypothetical protein